MNPYKYLYYRLYKYAEKTERGWGNASIPEWVALFSVSILLVINMGVFLLLFNYLFVFELNPSKITGIFIAGIIFLINYLIFIKDKKYLKIAELYSKETKKQGIYRTILVWLYIIFSITLFYIILPVLSGLW